MAGIVYSGGKSVLQYSPVLREVLKCLVKLCRVVLGLLEVVSVFFSFVVVVVTLHDLKKSGIIFFRAGFVLTFYISIMQTGRLFDLKLHQEEYEETS